MGRLRCGVDWSNGTDDTCIIYFSPDENGAIHILKTVFLTSGETELLLAALNKYENDKI